MGNICNCDKRSDDIDLASPQPDQAGGHDGGIVYDGDTITKKTKVSELLNYQKIFAETEDNSLTKLR